MATYTTSASSTTTYTKLRDGSWGLRGRGLSAGASVRVSKKSGETKTETVGRILWTGADGVSLATIGGASRSARTSSGGGECDECGRYSRRLESCRDSSGIIGACCERCAEAPSYERSFA